MTKTSKGKHAYSICQRSGLRYPYSEMTKEPGTGLWVHKSESDGRFNRVNHPQNAVKGRADSSTLKEVYPEPHLSTLFYLVDTEGNKVVSERGQFGYEEYILLD